MVAGGSWLSVVEGCVGSLCFSRIIKLISWFLILLGCLNWFRLFFVVTGCSRFSWSCLGCFCLFRVVEFLV